MTDQEYRELAHKLGAAFSALPALLDFEKTAADHHAEIARLQNDRERLIDAYRVQALASAADEIGIKHAKADEEIRKKEAAAQERQDAADADLRRTYKLIEVAKGDLERVNAQLAEVKRASHSFASRVLAG
jgi:hypothetical protein